MAYVRLFNHHVQIPYVLLSALECVALMVAVYLGIRLRLPDEVIDLTNWRDPFYLKAVLYAVVMLACTFALGVYHVRYREGFLAVAVRTVVSYCLLGAIALTVLFYVFPDTYLGRGVLTFAVVISFVFVMGIRWAFYQTVARDTLRRRILILGAGNKAKQIWELVEPASVHGGFRLVGALAYSPDPPKLDSQKVIQCSRSLVACAKEMDADEIVVALDERRRSEGGQFPLQELLDCKLSGIKVTDAITFCERETGRIEINLITPAWMVFSTGFRFSQIRDVSKRMFDITICLLLLIVALPLMLLTAILVFLDDGAPVLFRQTRTGLNGKSFTLYKFRSMRKDAEKNGAQWAQQNDSRITRVGNFIRNTRLDELPQIYNVLKGDMSFVGPRPERPEFVVKLEQDIDYYQERHRVKPGLMGWAQLKYPYGASVDDARNKLKYDLYYCKNHSLMLDIVIVLQTVEVILLGKGVR